jgi:hypothetical protein
VEVLTSVDAILSKDTRRTDEVEVPEWGGAVRIRAFSKSQYIAMQTASGFDSNGEGGDLEMFQKQMFLHGVEEPKFTQEQVDALFSGQSGGIVDRVLVAIAELNALGTEAAKRAKAKFRQP